MTSIFSDTAAPSDNDSAAESSPLTLPQNQALEAAGHINLTNINEDVADRVRLALVNILNGQPLDVATGNAGFTEAAFLALAVANQSVMAAMATTIRTLGLRSALKVQFLAERAATSPQNIPGLRAAMDSHKWFAQNTVPEMLARTSTREEARAHMSHKEQEAKRAHAEGTTIRTGVEEEE